MLGSAEVARLLDELGRRSALRRGNPYRAKAYRRAAESLLALPTPLHEVIEAGELRQIPGVGNAIADIIRQACCNWHAPDAGGDAPGEAKQTSQKQANVAN
jgi:DNA polymerase/3'-5' exonuclease PolX